MKRLLLCLILSLVAGGAVLSDTPPPKTSEFVFARVEFTMRDYWMYWFEAPWHHDYPFSDEFLPDMVREVTNVRTNVDSHHVVQLSSSEIFQYPFLYFSEPGFMKLTDKEIANLGEYIRRGGFIMADDFRAPGMLAENVDELEVLRHYLKQAVPEYNLVRLTVSHPIFNTYFKIDSLTMPTPYPIPDQPEFWGLQDERGKLHFIACYNNDLGEFWEWVDRGDRPFHDAALSVKLGVNFVLYAMTH